MTRESHVQNVHNDRMELRGNLYRERYSPCQQGRLTNSMEHPVRWICGKSPLNTRYMPCCCNPEG